MNALEPVAATRSTGARKRPRLETGVRARGMGGTLLDDKENLAPASANTIARGGGDGVDRATKAPRMAEEVCGADWMVLVCATARL